MSTIRRAGNKGYVVMGIFLALFLFVILCIYIYKLNNERVPEDPMYYGWLYDGARALLA